MNKVEKVSAQVRDAVAKVQYRDFAVRQDAIDKEKRTVELCFSSEEPYTRYWGVEILDHAASSVRLGRLNNGGAVLVDHKTGDQVGVVERAWLDADRRCRALVRFGKSARAEEIFQDVIDGIRKLISVGYQIYSYVLESKEGDEETYRVTDWEPLEVSFVAIPADATVGVGRARELHAEIPGEVPATQPAAPIPPANREATNMEKKDEKQGDNGSGSTVVVSEQDIRKQEQSRIREITAMAEKFGQRELGVKHVEAGTSVEAFGALLLKEIKPTAEVKVADDPNIGMSKKELQRFSFVRALLSASDPTNEGFRKLAAFELECSNAARAKMGDLKKEREGGFTIPTDVLNAPVADLSDNLARAMTREVIRRMSLAGQRDLLVGTPTAGGHTVATDLLASSFIDMLLNQMVLSTLGVTMLRDLNGNVAIPRQTGKASTYWVAENGAPTESQAAFDQVTMTPKTVGAYMDYSRRLLLQSSLDVEAFVRMDIARAVALALDDAGYNGTGTSNQPTGILNMSGIGSVAGGANGLAPTWDHFVDMESAVANANVFGDARYVTNTKVRGKAKRTQFLTGDNTLWKAVNEQNAPVAISNAIPSNLTKGTSNGVCSAIIYGIFRDLIIGMWGGLDVMLDPYAGATAGTKRVIALQDVDINARHPESFSAMKDALTV